jgi:outer membrane receptor for ferrienterochelin and colicins
MAKQKIAFGQLTWDKPIGSHNILAGGVLRYNYYDDNSTATVDTLSGRNNPDKHAIPGFFIQDEWKFGNRHMLLTGIRYDHHPVHKSIFTPRIAWKWVTGERSVFRLNAGTGFRVVSLFTEEHAALTGARAVEIIESLKPERSYNVNLNYTQNYRLQATSINLDFSAWYSYFTNQILPDYDTDPNRIIYRNLRGYSASKGVTLNFEVNSGRRLKSMFGVTLQDVVKVEKNAQGKNEKQHPMLTEKWSGTWSVSYTFPAIGFSIDYTGNIYGPMRLPLLSPTDPRSEYSPVWSIQNIQFTKHNGRGLEFFAGIKNLLNWTPAKKAPFLIARSQDPFDKNISYNPDGSVKVVNDPSAGLAHNPYGLSFDPAYVYAPNQGLRVFVGVRMMIN